MSRRGVRKDKDRAGIRCVASQCWVMIDKQIHEREWAEGNAWGSVRH
jgi:hypothetical protein